MNNNFKFILVALVTILLASCDKDFNTLENNIIGNENFNFTKKDDYLVKAYSKPTGEIQTNGLTQTQLGIYSDPYFGKTQASFVTQVSLSQTTPDFGTNPEIERVTIYIPYTSKVESTDAIGVRTYSLNTNDFFNETKKIKLSVFENGYYLDPFDNFEFKRYFSDLTPTIESFKRGTDANGNSVANGTRLNNSNDVKQNDEFVFSNAEIKVYKQRLFNGVLKYTNEAGTALTDQNDVSLRFVEKTLAPGMYLELDSKFFSKLLLQSPAGSLAANNTFKQFFRGLYFKTEEFTPNNGALANLNFASGRLLVNYATTIATVTERVSREFTLSLGGTSNVSVNLLNFAPNSNYSVGLAASDQLIGNDEKLYIKGGKGSVAYIELFSPTELAQLRTEKPLINDAFLTFCVDRATLDGVSTTTDPHKEPLRLYLYDVDNNRPLLDFDIDASTNADNRFNKLIHDGIIRLDSDKKGTKYVVRLTQHINKIINSTNTTVNKNVRLGLAVTENINQVGMYSLKTPFTLGFDEVKFIPGSSIISPRGTILFGPKASNLDKKLKLELYFSKPN